MDKNRTFQLCLIIGGILLVAIGVYVYTQYKGKKESYSNLADVDNVGSLDGTQYDLIPAAEMEMPAAHFADLVDEGDHTDIIQQPHDILDHLRPMDRLARLTASQLLPRTAASVTPYNIDVADPNTYLFSVNGPKVQLKNRLASQADFYRGDIPIKYHPNIALIGKSSNGRDSQKLDGTFSAHGFALWNKYTGKGYLNMPLKVANQETVMDYQ